MLEWNWSKLPETEYQRVRELYENRDWAALLEVHNQYQLSPYEYSCCYIEAMINYFGQAIEKEWI